MREGVVFNLAVASAGQKAHRRREMIRRPHRRPCVTGSAGKLFRLIQQLRCNAHSTSIAVHSQPANFRFLIAAPVYTDAPNGFARVFGNPEVAPSPLDVALLDVSEVPRDSAIDKLVKTGPVCFGLQVTLHKIFLTVPEQTAGRCTVGRLELSKGDHASSAVGDGRIPASRIDEEVDDVAIAHRIQLALRAQHAVLATLRH